MSLSDIIASLGVCLLLVAFFLNLRKYKKVESRWYSGLNAIRASLCCYSAWLINFYPFVVLEAIWVLTALMSFVKRVPRETIIK